VRAGRGFAAGVARHGAGPERHWVRETRSALLWGAALPAAALALALPSAGASLALLLAYPVQALRIYRRTRRERPARSRGDAALYALACLAAKPAGAWGVLRHHASRLRGAAALPGGGPGPSRAPAP
jgi:hypothetical protein